MAKPTGFMEFARENPKKRPIAERVADFREIENLLPVEVVKNQAARCMDCGVAHCHNFGCPLGNLIPEWNDMVYRDQWQKSLIRLHATNNFPEITGRICPAPCETACTLAINREAVCIRHIELQIVERGWQEGWIQPEPAEYQTGRHVAVIGSGPCGLAAAQQLARAGHGVTVFEKSDRLGGLLRYGIPDFKLGKGILDRRLEQMRQEGVLFETGVDAGRDLSVKYLKRTFDAVLITAGATTPRDLPLPGRRLQGIHTAMDYLSRQNRLHAGDSMSKGDEISAAGKKVVVLGGGDTGADCVGTALRQGARTVTQIEILPEPPRERRPNNPWPDWPNILRTSSSHEEGCTRLWGLMTSEFLGTDDRLQAIRCVQAQWHPEGGGFQEISGTERMLDADLVLIAAGFTHVEHGPLVQETGLNLDTKGNIQVDEGFQTSARGIFAAGDCVMGASLVVRAIHQGREAAAAIDRRLI